jgi:hypothetical protein
MGGDTRCSIEIDSSGVIERNAKVSVGGERKRGER